MKKQISCFSAKCGYCKKPFERPSLGSFSYGECLLNTIDGRHYVLVSAFNSFPEKVKGLIPENKSGLFWNLLAGLADPFNEKKLTTTIVCPNCCSTNIEVVKAERVGEREVDEASFYNASKLSSAELIEHISTIIKNA